MKFKKQRQPVYHSFQELAQAQRNSGAPAEVSTRTEHARHDPKATENVNYFFRYMNTGREFARQA